MPGVQVLADGCGAFGAASDESDEDQASPFKLLCGNQKLYAFEQKFDDELYKLSIAVHGGKLAVLNYTENEPQWDTFEFAPFNQKENTIETYFTHSDTIYALITTKKNETKLEDIFKFNENSKKFEKLELESPEATATGLAPPSTVIIAENATGETSRIVIFKEENFHIFSIDMSDPTIKTATHIGDIAERGEYLMNKAYAAFRHGNNLYITFCEFHFDGSEWHRDHIIKYDLETKEYVLVPVAPDESVEANGGRPQFLLGPYSSWCSGYLWGFCGGQERKGNYHTTGFSREFNGESWVIVGLENDEARWKKRTEVIEEGLIAADHTKNATIVVTKDKTSVLYHDQTDE